MVTKVSYFNYLSRNPLSTENAAAPENDKFISLVSSAVKWVSKAAVPGMYLVDFMPFCAPLLFFNPN